MEVLIWEAPKLEIPEYRLYYDDQGYVICYTCEKLEGNFLVIDATTFIEARPDIRVVNKKLVRATAGAVISRLYKDTKGTLCEKEDISVITTEDGQYWNLKTHAL